MVKKHHSFGIFLLFVVVCFVLHGCSTDGNNSSDDEWTKVSDLSELTGTWKGSSVIEVPEIPLSSLFEGDEAEMIMLFLGNKEVLPASDLDYAVTMTITDTDAEMELTADCKRYLINVLGSEATASIVWLAVKEMYAEMLTEMIAETMSEEITKFELTDDYKIIAAGNSSLEDASIGDEDNDFVYVNQDKTKILIAFEDIFSADDSIKMKNLILERQKK